MFLKIFILGCGIATLFFCCSLGQEARNSATFYPSAHVLYGKEDTVIVFVIMRIYADSITNKNEITVKDKIYTTGRLKTHATGFLTAGSHITCFLYKGDNILDSIRVEHPLHRYAEYFDENKKMGIKEINEREGEFSVRFQLKGNGNRIKVMETLNENLPSQLTTIQL
jgi:hypothetical protein